MKLTAIPEKENADKDLIVEYLDNTVEERG